MPFTHLKAVEFGCGLFLTVVAVHEITFAQWGSPQDTPHNHILKRTQAL